MAGWQAGGRARTRPHTVSGGTGAFWATLPGREDVELHAGRSLAARLLLTGQARRQPKGERFRRLAGRRREKKRAKKREKERKTLPNRNTRRRTFEFALFKVSLFLLDGVKSSREWAPTA